MSKKRKKGTDVRRLAINMKEARKDLNMLNGVPPYDNPMNFCWNDNYFAASLKRKYGMSIDELGKLCGIRRAEMIKVTCNGNEYEYPSITDEQLLADLVSMVVDGGFDIDEIVDTETNKQYACRWSVTVEERD